MVGLEPSSEAPGPILVAFVEVLKIADPEGVVEDAETLFNRFVERLKSHTLAEEWSQPRLQCSLASAIWVVCRCRSLPVSLYDISALLMLPYHDLAFASNHLLAFSSVEAPFDDPAVFFERAMDAVSAPPEALHISNSLLAISRAAFLAFGFRGPDFAAACVLVACRGLEFGMVEEKRLKNLIVDLHLRSRGTLEDAVLSIFASLSRVTRWLPFIDDFSLDTVDCYLPEMFDLLLEVMDIDAGEPFGIEACKGRFVDIYKIRKVTRIQRICLAVARLKESDDITIDIGILGMSKIMATAFSDDRLQTIDETLLDSLLRSGVDVFQIAQGHYNIDCISLIDSDVELRRKPYRYIKNCV